jgi:predicted MPP superfamily phosphohydrolase
MEIKPHFDSLSKISADIGVFGCLGNHDHYMSDENHKVLRKAIAAANIDEINNSNRIITIDGSDFNLMGVDNTGMRQDYADFSAAAIKRSPFSPTVLLCHDPRNWDNTVLKDYKDIDLMLSGHTHGGQIAVELLGLELAPVKYIYQRYDGLYKEGDQHLYVNRGAGTTGPPIRIGVNPEITEFTLIKA